MGTGVAVFQPLVVTEQVFQWRTEDASDFSAQHYMLCFRCVLACAVLSGAGCYNAGRFAACGRAQGLRLCAGQSMVNGGANDNAARGRADSDRRR